MKHRPTLLLPEKTDTELEQVATAWAEQGGIVQKLGKYWIKDEQLAQQQLAVYGNQTFALILAQLYHLELISPNEEWIATLDTRWTKRKIQQLTVNEVDTLIFPIFIKPIVPKLFTAKVYETLAEFSSLSISPNEQILVANMVDIEAEARSFIYNAEIQDFAIYSGTGNLERGRVFCKIFWRLMPNKFPKVWL